jgi:hypothetical protein
MMAASVGWGAEPVKTPGEVQVWNCQRWQTVSLGDFSGINSNMTALQPIALLATRNAVSSGCVVVTRNGGPIDGLKATVGDLTLAAGGKRIPASQVMVRYADLARPENSWMPRQRFDRLLEKAPAQVPCVDLGKLKIRKFTPRSRDVVATVPVWVTVRVPADAAPGDYQGSLSIQAAGLASGSVKVPIHLKVHEWVMPDPGNFRVRTIGWMNPEAQAKHYGVELWSDRHFELMGESMERMLQLGSRHIQINVCKGYPAQGNSDTMIKWIRQADGSFKYDFSLFDKYCDLAAKKIGKPFPVRLNMWRGPRNGGGGETDDYPNATVLVLDPASGKVTDLAGPTRLGSPEMRAFWKPVMDQLRSRLEKRGWFDVTGTNWMCYCGGMTPQMADMVRSIWPDGKWTDVTHGRVRKYRTTTKGVFAPVFVQSTVWNEGTLGAHMKWKSGPYPRQYANKFDPATAWCTHGRTQYWEQSGAPLWVLRTKHEEAMLKGNDGLECVGADHFPSKDGRGRYRPGPWSAYAQGPKNATLALLGAGEKGPIGTERFEAMREGIQLCEAMVFIQKALEAGTLDADLAARADKFLDDRAKATIACWKIRTIPYGNRKIKRPFFDLHEYAKDAPQRDDRLFALAGEVMKKLAEK